VRCLSAPCIVSFTYLVSKRLLVTTTGAALPENNEATAKLTTANGGTFT